MISISTSIQQVLEYSSQQLLGQPVTQLFNKHSDYQNFQQKVDAQQGKINTYTTQLRKQSDKLIWVSIDTAYWRDAEQNIIGIEAFVQDISALKHSQEMLMKTQQQLFKIRHLTQIGTWEYHHHTGQLICSDEIFQLYETDRKNFTGSYTDFIQSVHPHDREKVWQVYSDSLAKQTPYSTTHRLRMHDGRVKWVQERCETLFDEKQNHMLSHGTVQDLTEIKQTEEALRESETRFKDLYDNAPDMYCSVDAKDATIVQCNNTMVKNLGYSKDEIIGMPIFNIYHPDALEEANKCFKSFAETGRAESNELKLKRKNGTSIDVSLAVASVRDRDGKVVRSRSTWRDISAYKQAEQTAKLAQTQLLHASKLASIGTLATGIGHELNNPLQVIIFALMNLSEEVRENIETENLLKQLNNISEHAQRMADIIENMRDFARSGINSSSFEEVSIEEIWAQSIGLIETQLNNYGVQIDVNIPSNLATIIGNRGQLGQVFINLLTNARDALKSTYNPRLEIHAKPDKDFIAITFYDNGVGISEEHIDKIFDPFFSTKEIGHGTGLGLSISHGIISEHGGTIFLTSKAGHGTTVTIRLPISQ